MEFKRTVVVIVLLATLLAMVGCNSVFTQPSQAVPPTEATLSVDEILGTPLPKNGTVPPLPLEALLAPNQNLTITPTQAITTPSITPTSMSTQAAEPAKAVCGGPDALIITVLGIDENAQADAIRLVRIDFVKQEVSTLAVPRDFWVQIADMSAYGIDENRINATYGFGEYFNGSGQGIVSLNRNLESNFGVKGDRFLVLHFTQIEEYINIVGGVDVFLDQPVEDGRLFFSGGQHHFDGATAVSFMRVREHDSDFQRVKRQTLVLSAFFKKLTSEMDPGQLLSLAKRVLTANPPITDLKLNELTATICLARRLGDGKVHFEAIPSDMYHGATTNRGAAVLIPHPEAAKFIQSVINGTK